VPAAAPSPTTAAPPTSLAAAASAPSATTAAAANAQSTTAVASAPEAVSSAPPATGSESGQEVKAAAPVAMPDVMPVPKIKVALATTNIYIIVGNWLESRV
jgi:hypothetical protein